MRTRRSLRPLFALLILSLVSSPLAVVSETLAQSAGPAPPAPPSPEDAATPTTTPTTEATPLRISYVDGEVSFWRPGGEDWGPARANTPLAPGDMLYTGPRGNVEIQIGPRAFVRATGGAEIGLDNQEPAFLQVRVMAGTVALDLRHVAAGSTVELATPTAAFSVERAGLYRLDVNQDATTFRAYRGGSAIVTPPSGQAVALAANKQALVTTANPDEVVTGAAPGLAAWDQWNQQRTDYLVQHADARYVSAAVYGTEALAQHGTWRVVQTYGSVWVPAGVPAGWSPYSTGRWIWDPRFGWTWLDDAPWGWAPYHYGRWVFVGQAWAWVPGPIVARPVYAPALVVFLGGARVGRPLCWAPLGWGEPVIPWWGRRGFVGVPWWGGWGGPRVVNNVVINRHTTVNVTNISVYRNVTVTKAVVGVPADRFGRGPVQVTRISQAETRELKPVHGTLEVRPVPASLVPAAGPAAKPPVAPRERAVIATRAPQDHSAPLRAEGLAATSSSMGSPTTPRLVPAPRPKRSSPASTLASPSPGAQQHPRPSGIDQDKGKSGGRPAQAAPRLAPPQSPAARQGEAPPAAPPPGAAVTGRSETRDNAAASHRAREVPSPNRGAPANRSDLPTSGDRGERGDKR